MRGVDVDCAKGGGCVCTNGAHEGDGGGDAGDDGLIFGAGVGGLYMREGPFEGVVEVGEPGGELGAEVVEGRGGVEVRADEAGGVRSAFVREVAVDIVPAEGGDFFAIDDFGHA